MTAETASGNPTCRSARSTGAHGSGNPCCVELIHCELGRRVVFAFAIARLMPR